MRIVTFGTRKLVNFGKSLYMCLVRIMAFTVKKKSRVFSQWRVIHTLLWSTITHGQAQRRFYRVRHNSEFLAHYALTRRLQVTLENLLCAHTVKPVTNNHAGLGPEKAVFNGRWSLVRGLHGTTIL